MWLQRLQVPCAAPGGPGWVRWAQERHWTGIWRLGLTAVLPLDLNLGGYEVGCLLAGVPWEPVLMKGCCYSSAAKLCLTLFVSFVTLWTVAHQATLSMGFPTQIYWSCHTYSYILKKISLKNGDYIEYKVTCSTFFMLITVWAFSIINYSSKNKIYNGCVTIHHFALPEFIYTFWPSWTLWVLEFCITKNTSLINDK